MDSTSSGNLSDIRVDSDFQFHWMDSLGIWCVQLGYSTWLSIPLNGFLRASTWTPSTRAPPTFQFHWMDSSHSPSVSGGLPSVFQFHWMDSRVVYTHVEGLEEATAFQFHWMDSLFPYTSFMYASHPFNSIEWILKLVAELFHSGLTLTFNSIEWIQIVLKIWGLGAGNILSIPLNGFAIMCGCP